MTPLTIVSASTADVHSDSINVSASGKVFIVGLPFLQPIAAHLCGPGCVHYATSVPQVFEGRIARISGDTDENSYRTRDAPRLKMVPHARDYRDASRVRQGKDFQERA